MMTSTTSPTPTLCPKSNKSRDILQGLLKSINRQCSIQQLIRAIQGYMDCYDQMNALSLKVDPRGLLQEITIPSQGIICDGKVFKQEYQQQNTQGQCIRNLHELYQAAQQAQSSFEQFCRQIIKQASASNANNNLTFESSVKMAPLKDKQRALEKAENDYALRIPPPEEAWLYDIVRGSIYASTQEELLAVVNVLQSPQFAPSIIKAKNRFQYPEQNGYRDLIYHISVAVSDTYFHICELQVHHQAFVKLTKQLRAHDHYRLLRSLFVGDLSKDMIQLLMKDLRQLAQSAKFEDSFLLQLLAEDGGPSRRRRSQVWGKLLFQQVGETDLSLLLWKQTLQSKLSQVVMAAQQHQEQEEKEQEEKDEDEDMIEKEEKEETTSDQQELCPKGMWVIEQHAVQLLELHSKEELRLGIINGSLSQTVVAVQDGSSSGSLPHPFDQHMFYFIRGSTTTAATTPTPSINLEQWVQLCLQLEKIGNNKDVSIDDDPQIMKACLTRYVFGDSTNTTAPSLSVMIPKLEEIKAIVTTNEVQRHLDNNQDDSDQAMNNAEEEEEKKDEETKEPATLHYNDNAASPLSPWTQAITRDSQLSSHEQLERLVDNYKVKDIPADDYKRLDINTQDAQEIAVLYYTVGEIYRTKYQDCDDSLHKAQEWQTQAMSCWQHAVKFATTSSSSSNYFLQVLAAKCYNAMGTIHTRQLDYTQAQQAHQQALGILQQAATPHKDVAMTLEYMAEVLYRQGYTQAAEEKQMQARQVTHQVLGEDFVYSRDLFTFTTAMINSNGQEDMLYDSD